jgi:hypothetical protein
MLLANGTKGLRRLWALQAGPFAEPIDSAPAAQDFSSAAVWL